MAREWKIYYKGWVIKHDPLGKVACYRVAGYALEWCYFGSTVAEIKAEIDRREYVASLGTDEED